MCNKRKRIYKNDDNAPRNYSKLRTKRENCNRSVKCNEAKRYLFLRDNEKGSRTQPATRRLMGA